LKHITASRRQANSIRLSALLKAGVPGIPWQLQNSGLFSLEELPPGDTSPQQK